jgi:hypothetical protein
MSDLPTPRPRTAYTNSKQRGRVRESYGLHGMPNAGPRGAITAKATRSLPFAVLAMLALQ